MTSMQIETLYRRAQNGDTAALSELRYANQIAVNRVKRRIKTIRNHNISTPALDRLEATLERENLKLSKSKSLTPDQLRAQLHAIQKFDEAKTGSYKGYLEYESEELERLRESDIVLDRNTFRNEWKDFLNSPLFEEMKAFDSERALLEGAEALKSGRSFTDITEAWEKYTQGDAYFSEVWEEFTGEHFI